MAMGTVSWGRKPDGTFVTDDGWQLAYRAGSPAGKRTGPGWYLLGPLGIVAHYLGLTLNAALDLGGRQVLAYREMHRARQRRR